MPSDPPDAPPWHARLDTRINLSLVLGLALMLGIGLSWLSTQGKRIAERDEVERAETTAETAISSLKSIMLAGRGPIAHQWLERLTHQPTIDFARIYRVDGTEAFHDLKTVNAVNAFLGKARFHRQPIPGGGTINPTLKPLFDQVVRQGERLKRRDGDRLTVLYPIHVERACRQCHGYTSHPLRGVLVLGMNTRAAASRVGQMVDSARWGLGMMLVVFTSLALWLFRRQVIRPLDELRDAALAIIGGNLEHRVRSQRKDEFGVVANAFDQLVDHLQTRIERENRQAERQRLLTEAVIELSRQTAGDDMLRHVGDLARRVTHARYAMVTYTDTKGERHLIPSGISDEQAQAIARPPRGKGLLGLFWEAHEPVRVDDIAAHPASVGFPDGHPVMKTLLGVPIVFAHEPLGAIYLCEREDGEPFDEDDERIVTTLASACAVALSNLRNTQSELARINQRLQAREIELELLNEELVRANEAKSQFLANTSHELRTPLNAIIGFSELLKNPKTGELSDTQRRYVEHVHTSGKRLLAIINDLLDIGKIEAGMMTIEEVVCQPCEIARNVIQELLPLAGQKHIALTLEAECGEDEQVVLDAGKLHQMLVNLVGNALKFTPEEGKVSVRVRIDHDTPTKPRVVMAVEDTGCGIAPEDQEKIFEPFVQARGGLAREHGGTGLGLALTRKQVNLLGGSIRLQSEVGKGSCFTIELPAEPAGGPRAESPAVEAEEETEAEAIESAAVEVVPAHGPRPKIVVVDDEADRARAVVELLEKQGYEAHATDMAHVVQRCESLCPYLIMLGLPEHEDHLHQRLQELKTHRASRDLPVILVGGSPDELEFSLGPVDVVEKGVRQQEMLDMISRFCRYVPTHPEVPSVLVIDDDASVREFLKETLVAEGFRVLLARSGIEGVQMAIEREPDMIILDLMMPKVSGFDVLRQLERNPDTANIPVVIYTAKELTREEALKLGREAESVLIKGAHGRAELLRRLQKLELLYPARAHMVDPVLDCFNLRYMRRRLEEEVANAQRYNLQFALVTWEMEDYAEYVREHGERWGIAALKEMLETVRTVTRRGDICARVSEARFLLLLMNATPTAAMRVAEKLRIRIRHQRFLLPDDQVGQMHASFAIAHYSEDADDVNHLLRIAEERLREAIEAGGDQGCYGGEI